MKNQDRMNAARFTLARAARRCTQLTALLLLTFEAQAFAGNTSNPLTGVGWREVDNSTNTVTGEATGLAGQWRTFDLFLFGEPGTLVNAINMGSASNPVLGPFTILTDGAMYNDSLASGPFAPNPLTYPVSPAAEFDTYLTFQASLADSISVLPGSVDLESSSLRGVWFATPVPGEDWRQSISAQGDFWLLRATVSADATYLGGVGSSIQIGITTSEPIFDVPNALLIPAPGVSWAVCAGLAISVRRRRR